ncbi:MAG: ABC transporter substrate-binding protein [Anaerolineales bacterium]
MLSRKLVGLTTLIVVVSMLLAACGAPAEPETVVVTEVVERTVEVEVERTVEVEVERTVEVEVEREPAGPDISERQGALIDTIVVVEEPSSDQAVTRLEVGEIDMYAHGVGNPDVAQAVFDSPNLDSYANYGSYNELTFNPSGPVFEGTGKLNPFAVPRVREAMNYLIDRNYIVEEIAGGLGTPRWLPFNNASNDYALMADVARELELKYAYNPELAEEIISEEMEAMGATLEGDVWQYEGEPVEIFLLIRTEDERRDIGDYVGNQLEDIGFTVTRDYRSAAEASPIWIQGNPEDGQFHIYTGGWITTVVPRSLYDNFAFFYTDMGLGFPLWQAYENDPEFYEISERLLNSDFRTVEERREMMAEALELAMKDSVRIWLNDSATITPKRKEVSVAADLYGGVSGAWLWPVTIQREGEVGGAMNIAMPSILSEPWNPLDGSNWIYDMMLIRATGEMGYVPDPYTGLWWPRRFERAEVVVEEGLPVFKSLDWVDLEFAAEITVPDDAWVDWDAEEQRFLTAGEVYTETETALRKSTVYYPDDLYDTVKWHDGSSFSIADVIMAMIVTFDRAKEASPVYDEAIVPDFNSFLSSFRGMRIISEDPLVIEHYSDYYAMDAEQSINSWWPYFDQGQASWHMLALGLMAEEKLEAAFTSGKADANEIEWLSYIAGPTVDILKAQLDEALEESTIPYEPTLGQYMTADEAQARFENYAEWFRRRGHFWIGTGPFYLERAFPVEGTVVLQRNREYPDMADRWMGFAEPPIATVELDGPGRVTIGEEAAYEVFVTFEDTPYPIDDINNVKYLVFDAEGSVAHVGEAEAVEDGLWEFALDADVTGDLEAGSNRLEVVVVSERVAVPSFDSLTFVTAP